MMAFSSPAVSDGGIDDHGQNRGRNQSNMHKQRELGHRRSSMRSNVNVLAYCSVAKFQCAVLTVCSILMSTKSQSSRNEKIMS